MTDFKKEWFAKARVDYFSPFVNLWLACNSWYNFHYSLTQDRAHVNKLKTDFSNSNKLFNAFKRYYANGNSKNEKAFLSLLELLHFSLNQALIRPEKFHANTFLSFSTLLIDFDERLVLTSYHNAIIPNAQTQTGALRANVNGIILSDGIVFDADKEKVFAGLIEMIYQVRCMLVHGSLAPSATNHEVVKYCYLVLFELMKDFCE